MGRIRTVKPDFWKHEELSALPESVHMLAAALLNYADDEGYFNANDKLVKAECCPLRESSVSVHDALKQLSEIGYLRLGNGPAGKRYGHVINFEQHQRVNRKTDSKIKKMEIVWDGSVRTHPQLTESSPPEGKGREGNKDAGASAPPSDEADYFRRGKQVAGPSSGGLLAKILKFKKGSVPLARAAVEQAATKSDPREYLGRILAGPMQTEHKQMSGMEGVI